MKEKSYSSKTLFKLAGGGMHTPHLPTGFTPSNSLDPTLVSSNVWYFLKCKMVQASRNLMAIFEISAEVLLLTRLLAG